MIKSSWEIKREGLKHSHSPLSHCQSLLFYSHSRKGGLISSPSHFSRLRTFFLVFSLSLQKQFKQFFLFLCLSNIYFIMTSYPPPQRSENVKICSKINLSSVFLLYHIFPFYHPLLIPPSLSQQDDALPVSSCV